MGLDPGWGTSSFGIVVVHFVDGIIRVSYVDDIQGLIMTICYLQYGILFKNTMLPKC